MGSVHRVSLLLLLLLTALTAGCISESSGDADGSESEPVEGDPMLPEGPKQVSKTVTYNGFYPVALSYTSELEVEQGAELTLTFQNNDSNPVVSHDWYLEALDVGTEIIGAGESISITFIVDLEPGDYVYYCTLSGHRDNGMEGTLTVVAPA